MQTRKIEVVASTSSLLLNSIQDNIAYDSSIETNFVSFEIEDFVSSKSKIDLFIIDSTINYASISLHRIKTIVNLTNVPISENEIFFKLPFKLARLLTIIHDNRISKQIFNSIKHQWIYDEQSSTLLNGVDKIRLTEKENEVIRCLYLAKNNIIHKDDLRQKIWKHHIDSDSNAVEIQLYRLKQKLPDNLMQIKDNYYSLNII